MKSCKKSVKLTLGITYFLMAALIVFIVALPFVSTWYAEKMKRPADLVTVTMLSCYPCVPFATVALFSLKKFLKNILKGDILVGENSKLLKRIAVCCVFAGAIMLIAGFFYKPFFISGTSAALIALVIKVMYDILENFKERYGD